MYLILLFFTRQSDFSPHMVFKSDLRAKYDTWLHYIRWFENQPGVQPLLFALSTLPIEILLYYVAPVLPGH